MSGPQVDRGIEEPMHEVVISMASMANACAAMRRIFSATAACCPTGTPHWMRSRPQSRAICSARLVVPMDEAGMERRPALSVLNATFRPRPTPPTT